MKSIRSVTAAGLVAGLALLLAACGSSNSSTGSSSNGSSSSSNSASSALSTGGYKSPLTESLTGKTGGTLTVLQEIDFEHLDPGIAYFSVDYAVVFATQRPLYSQKPNSTEATPDMAEGAPEVSGGGKTVTVHLKEGIDFSPPVNREVTSEDVAYAIERGANPNVANPYIQSYFKAIEGMPTATGGPIKGIETPSKHEIVFHLTEPKGQLVADALVLPLTAAVPKEYAEKFDKHKPSNYADFQVATGPYMLKNDAKGKVLGIGYIPGKSATLVRNPKWNPKTDYRPAYLNEIDIKIGGTSAVIGRQVLEGTNIVQNESAVAQSAVRLAAEKYKSQLQISPGAGAHYIGVNNKVGPFKNVDVRKALWAALDRQAMDKARGGELVTTVATHFIYPTINGFEQAGGVKGPQGSQFDFNAYPEGNMKVAEKYLKLAGYPSGKYTGNETITVVGSTGSPQEQDAEIVEQTLKSLGFTVKFTLVEASTMYAKYCNVPKEEITVCPSVAWIADFADPQTVLNITFNGTTIVPTGNVNWSQTNVPKINAAMAAAENVVGNEARAKAWAKIDEELVEDAAAVPFDWDKQAGIEGSAVNGVGDLWDVGEWDYSYTSLK
ncbi:MAG TPA: ABC transporter substrate-binding protein [Solirubrobacteraceae bacterium]|jgi:peptide/nickel transport system substrate-binding protein|nr:ABC transporter substrate-binding protein [Solirubrobacteraceae bacterium]